MIVFDAGVLIAHLERREAFHAAAGNFMSEHEEFEFAANALTIAETLVRATTAGRAATVLDAYRRLHLIQADFLASDASVLAEVRAATRLRMPDALVVHTAEALDGEVVTTDASLARAARERGRTAHLLQRDP